MTDVQAERFGGPEHPPVHVRPRRSELVDAPKLINPTTILVKVFAMTEEGNRRHVLIPAWSDRWVSTELLMDCGQDVLPLISAPRSIGERHMQVGGYRFDEETEELQIQIISSHADSQYLAHGDPLAVFHFVSAINVELAE